MAEIEPYYHDRLPLGELRNYQFSNSENAPALLNQTNAAFEFKSAGFVEK